ncbi:hypothetical protein ERUR111494_05510 [Erysipelothrix urinaevulpis]|uniref:hypothetical protein n=1 Tax=Erysipelothrix urinaevulpis TaxID=2683717 RepID=UPI00135A251A|nr:hypothetical protein [Erysipelothrix urinaevulpis]
MNKEEIQQLRNNLIKDHRRRMLYLIKGEQAGYHMNESDLKFVSIYEAKELYSLLIFLVTFGILKQKFILAVGIVVLLNIAIYIYFNKFFLSDKNIIKIREQEYEKLDSLEAHEEFKADAFSKTILPLFLVIIIFSVLIKPDANNNNPIDINLMRATLVLLPVYSVQHFMKYLRERKIVKGMKKE